MDNHRVKFIDNAIGLINRRFNTINIKLERLKNDPGEDTFVITEEIKHHIKRINEYVRSIESNIY